MPVFTNETLTRFFNQGEDHISHERPFLVGRLSLDIVANTAVYTLPDYVISIKRITYKGMKLDPLPQRNFREVFQSATQKGRPFWYVYNNVGINKIQLFPCPNESVADATTNLWDTSIDTSVIMEYYRVTENSTFILPAWIRRQLLKLYVAKQCFSIEGAGQNIKMARYFDARWENKKEEFFSLLRELYEKPRKLMTNEVVSSNYFPAGPVLPIASFGIGVDDGY
jgi:hypothetical protein